MITRCESRIRFHATRITICRAVVTLFLLVSSRAFSQSRDPAIDSLTYAGERQLAAGTVDSARDSFEDALDLDKRDLRSRIGLGRTYFEEGEWGDARDEFEKALKYTPGNLDAHYYTAICYRELGKTKAWIFRDDSWKKARRNFLAVVAADSSFRDVLHQYAILEEYDKEFPHALELAHAGLRLRPDLEEPRLDLFRLYHHFIAVSDTGESMAWLRLHPSPYARFFTGEVLRASHRLDDAETVFRAMLLGEPSFPPEAPLLSLVRIAVKRHDTTSAHEEYWRTVDSLRSSLGADLVFDDLKYIMTDGELQIYRALPSVDQKKTFFRSFWNLRNPLAGSAVNTRLFEHYSRMLFAEENFSFYGFRIWFNNPDKTGMLNFPRTYFLNHRFNDKGLIFLRHGLPGQIERAAGLGPDNAAPNESWLYYATPEVPKQIFHFVSIEGSYWRLAPLPTDTRMYDALAAWDAQYGRLASQNQLERLNVSKVLMDETREDVTVALSTDRHNWKRDVRKFPILTSVDAFRSEGGRSMLDISYAIPMPVIARVLPATATRAVCEVGVSITNLTTRAIANKLDTITFPVDRHSPGFITNLIRYVVRPDSYAIAMHVHPLGVEAFGTWETGKRVRDFRAQGLLLSDLQFLMPSNSPASVEIDGIKVIQVPFTSYSRGNPVYVYCQIYNLADNGGRTSFTAEYSLTPLDDVSGERQIVLKRSAREGVEEWSAEFAALNIDGVQPGKYVLSIRVTDHYFGASAVRSRVLEVADD